MAKRKSGGSLAGLQNQKKRLRNQLSAVKKKKRDASRAAKLRREVASLQKQVRNARKKSK